PAPAVPEVTLNPVDAQGTDAAGDPVVSLSGSQSGLAPGSLIYVAYRAFGDPLWRFRGPALVRDEEWRIPDLPLAPPPGATGQPEQWEAAALVTRSALPGENDSIADWQPYAL